MPTDDLTEERLRLLMAAKSAYQNRLFNELDKSLQVAAVRKLNSFGVLSIAAIAAVVGTTKSRVRKAVGPNRPEARGKLNPAHLDYLTYLLTGSRKAATEWIKDMVEHGTSVNTIADLTLMSRTTIYRRLNA